MATIKTPSPSRTYVAMCNSGDFKSFYFRKFSLPEKDIDGSIYENEVETASWYFLNRLNFVACLADCLTFEDYQNLHDQKDPHQQDKDEKIKAHNEWLTTSKTPEQIALTSGLVNGQAWRNNQKGDQNESS